MWQIMKEVLGRARKSQSLLPRIIVSKIEITEEKGIANYVKIWNYTAFLIKTHSKEIVLSKCGLTFSAAYNHAA